MEQIYYPSRQKLFLYKILYPICATVIGESLVILFLIFQTGTISPLNWARLSGAFIAILLFSLDAFFGKHLAIKLTHNSIHGPINGIDLPIPFDEIDFENFSKNKRIHSLRGDRLEFDARLFESDDVDEILRTIEKIQNQFKKDLVVQRIFHPAPKKQWVQICRYSLIGLVVVAAIIFLISAERGTKPSFLWILLTTLLVTIYMIIQYGIRGDRLAIKVTNMTFLGPSPSGRIAIIKFDEIDFDRSYESTAIWSIRGDQIQISENLFDEKDLNEIWGILEELEEDE